MNSSPDFPEIAWDVRPFKLYFSSFVIAFLFLNCIGGSICGIQMYSYALSIFFGLLSVPFLFLFYANWTTHHAAKFILKYSGIYYTGWKAEIQFQEIGALSIVMIQGRPTLVLQFKKLQASPWKFNIPSSLKTSGAYFPLSNLRGEPETIGQTILRYYSHQSHLPA